MTKSQSSRSAVLLFLAAWLAGCASSPKPDPTAEAIHCYRNKVDRYRVGPCTTVPVPSLAADADAKTFKPDPVYLTVYVVRRSWGDGWHLLKVFAGARPGVETLPDTMVRMRLPPGEHELSFEFDGQRKSTRVAGTAGEVVFMRLAGTAWAWSSQYEWVYEPPLAIRERAAKTRLVADLLAR